MTAPTLCVACAAELTPDTLARTDWGSPYCRSADPTLGGDCEWTAFGRDMGMDPTAYLPDDELDRPLEETA